MPSPLSARDLTWMCAAVLVVWAALFAPQLGGRVFVLGDAAAYRPFAELSRARWLESHQRTFWNPYVFAGLAATASLADSRPQYLPDAALDAIERLRRVPGWPPLSIPLLSHLAGMCAMALLARGLWGVGPAAMAWAALAWGLMPNLVVPLAFGHDAQFVTAALIPVALLAVHHLFAARERRRMIGATLALGLTLGFQGLAGHPQFLAYSGLLVITFAVERWRHFGRGAGLFATLVAALLGAALSAAVWLPAFLYGAQTVRGGLSSGVPLVEVADFSHRARDLASLFWPWAMGFGGATYWGGLRQTDYPQYLGITVLVVALWAWPRRGEAGRGTTLFLALAAISAVLLALGAHLGPFYHFLHRHLPLFSKFRVAVAVLIVAQLAVALLSARGLERMLGRGPDGAPRRGWVGLAIAAGTIVALGVAIGFGPLHEVYARAATGARPALAIENARVAADRAGLDLVGRGLLIAALAVVVWLAAPRRGSRRAAIASAALGLLLVADLATVGAPLLRRATGPLATLEAPPPPPLARVAARDPHARALPLERAGFLSNRWVSWRARSLAGEHGAINRYWSELFSAGLMRHYPALCALAVRYVAGDGSIRVDTTLSRPVREGDTLLPVLALRDALPRAYAVASVVAPGSDQAVVAGMFSADFNPAAVAYAADPAAAGAYPGSASCRVSWIEDLPDRLTFETEAAERAFLVVADAFVPGWRARVDGQESTLFRVNHMVRGVALSPGRHRVTMSYRPQGWSAGVVSTRLAFVAVALVLLGLAFTAIRRPRRHARAPESG